MTLFWAIAAGIITVTLMAAVLCLRRGYRRLSFGLVLIGLVAAGVLSRPATREPLLARFVEPVVEPEPAARPGSQPARLSTLFSAAARTSRMPPDHPDPSAPRHGAHFTCHQDDAR